MKENKETKGNLMAFLALRRTLKKYYDAHDCGHSGDYYDGELTLATVLDHFISDDSIYTLKAENDLSPSMAWYVSGISGNGSWGWNQITRNVLSILERDKLYPPKNSVKYFLYPSLYKKEIAKLAEKKKKVCDELFQKHYGKQLITSQYCKGYKKYIEFKKKLNKFSLSELEHRPKLEKILEKK